MHQNMHRFGTPRVRSIPDHLQTPDGEIGTHLLWEQRC
jgi:hypothetical protein